MKSTILQGLSGEFYFSNGEVVDIENFIFDTTADKKVIIHSNNMDFFASKLDGDIQQLIITYNSSRRSPIVKPKVFSCLHGRMSKRTFGSVVNGTDYSFLYIFEFKDVQILSKPNKVTDPLHQRAIERFQLMYG